MVFTRKYNLINNLTGWGVFVIALLTYWLTLEPTASYWDCGEFIIQADKLEIGHPPGNPIFMLTARFFANFAFGDASLVALMVNAMSGLLSALTILLLFWTITHLTRRLAVKDKAAELSLTQYLIVMGSGVCGALAYAWSDTFWFSAVEAEVYAFSSFCTALVFWLILKWENRAEQPHSDRYLILIAYIIGVSIAVHLLNLLCIPAIVLVYCYRKVPDMNVKKSLLALLVGFAIIVFVLYGLVPGFIEVAGWFELFAVNTLHLPFNSGLIAYTVLTIGALVWSIYEITTQRSAARIRISFLLAVFISGILFIGSGLWIGILLLLTLCALICFKAKRLPMRWMGLVLWIIAVIFVGYSSYALILIRSNAHTPMNQNTPDNVFALSSYLNREQYGETPLLYGYTFESQPQMIAENYENPDYPGVTEQNKIPVTEKGKALYSKGVKGARPDNANGYLSNGQQEEIASLDKRGGDFYALYDYMAEPVMNPQLNMLLPRMHSSLPSHQAAYVQWVPDLLENSEIVEVNGITDADSDEEIRLLDYEYAMDPETGSYAVNDDGVYYHNDMTAHKPTFGQNLSFFFNYQLNHMYWRYFLWNFAGRQNDINNQNGEKDAGNWLSGIPFIDNTRLGDQSLLPDEYGKGNAAHNVFYMLPLLLGIIGLLWQAFCGKRGIEQFWVVFFLFFMTGIAIVLYLNQTPLQPRERDYAYAGSFYAFAIWLGMGVAALHRAITYGMERMHSGNKGTNVQAANSPADTADETLTGGHITPRQNLIAAGVAALIGLLVPLQMVSQTWDDHDRSGRYAARDYAINSLNSLEPNAIVFCNGDNDTFPLWYAQEVEGVRPDVKIINLSYLGSEWYANQQRLQTYKAAPVSFTATPQDYAYGRRDIVRATEMTDFYEDVPLLTALKEIYSDKALSVDTKVEGPVIAHGMTYIDVDAETVRKRGLVPEGVQPDAQIPVQLNSMTLGQMLMLDIIATNAAEGWKRPIYWACTVGTENYQQFQPYVRFTGMAYQLVPYQANGEVGTEITYDIIMGKNGKPGYLWGGADNYVNPPYFDETATRMLSATRLSMVDLAKTLVIEGNDIMSLEGGMTKAAKRKFDMAVNVLKLFESKLAGPANPLGFSDVYTLGTTWCSLGEALKNKDYMKRGLKVFENAMIRYASNVRYANMLASVWGVRKNTVTVGGKDVDVITGLNAQTTPENSYILFSYYELVKLYNSFSDIMAHGFDQAACSAEVLEGEQLTEATRSVLKKAGINAKLAERLKRYYTEYNMYSAGAGDYGSYGGDYANDTLDETTMRQYADELARWAEIVVTMQGKSEAEYAASSPEELYIDSIFYLGLQQFIDLGGSTEMLDEYPVFDQLDAERTLRLSVEFDKKHPDGGL